MKKKENKLASVFSLVLIPQRQQAALVARTVTKMLAVLLATWAILVKEKQPRLFAKSPYDASPPLMLTLQQSMAPHT